MVIFNSQDYDIKDVKNFWIDEIALQNMLSILLRNPLKGFEMKENFEAKTWFGVLILWDFDIVFICFLESWNIMNASDFS